MNAVLGLNRTQAASLMSKRTGLPVGESKLRYWESLGLVSPAPAKRPGRWHPATYSLRDLVTAEILATLRLDGASLPRLRRGLRALGNIMPEIDDAPGAWRLAVTRAGDVQRIENEQQVLELTNKPGQLALALLLDAGAIASEAREMIEQQKAAVA